MRTLSLLALASLDEMKRACGVPVDRALDDPSNFNDNLFDSLEFASDEVEQFLDRQIVSRGSLTEYHSPNRYSPAMLYLRQWPIISVTSVKEGYWTAGAFVPSLTLVAGTNYIADNDIGRLTRITGADPDLWTVGYERVQVVYTAGYANTAAVPKRIRRVCLSLAARRFNELNAGAAGVQSRTDGLGTVTRFLPAELLKMEQDSLYAERRYQFVSTGRTV